MSDKYELHLFLIWSNAYIRLNKILDDISKNFNIIEKIEILWSKGKFSENLTQFYGTKLVHNSFKENQALELAELLKISQYNIQFNNDSVWDLSIIIGKDYKNLSSYRDAVLFQPPF